MNKNTFIVVTWPDSQMLIEQEWFDECELINSESLIATYGNEAYFVPLERYNDMYKTKPTHIKIRNKSWTSYIDITIDNDFEVIDYSIKVSDTEYFVSNNNVNSDLIDIYIAIDEGSTYLYDYNDESSRFTLRTEKSEAINLINIFQRIRSDIAPYDLMEEFLKR